MATIHFEDLWIRAEKASEADKINSSEIIGQISSSINEIKDLYRVADNSKDAQLVQGFKSKAIGRLLFNLATLSAKENIDVYLALKDQLDVLKIKEQVNF